MGMATLPRGRKPAEYSLLGDVLYSQLARRGIRGNKAVEELINARGDYPRSITDETVRNYFIGKHGVPYVFVYTLVEEMNRIKPLTAQEKRDLETAYTWGQQPKDSPLFPENIDRAHLFVEDVEEEERGQDPQGEQPNSGDP